MTNQPSPAAMAAEKIHTKYCLPCEENEMEILDIAHIIDRHFNSGGNRHRAEIISAQLFRDDLIQLPGPGLRLGPNEKKG
jgi:hypothetical protein